MKQSKKAILSPFRLEKCLKIAESQSERESKMVISLDNYWTCCCTQFMSTISPTCAILIFFAT